MKGWDFSHTDFACFWNLNVHQSYFLEWGVGVSPKVYGITYKEGCRGFGSDCMKTASYLRSMILRTSNLSLRFLQPKVPRRLRRDVKSSRKPTWNGELGYHNITISLIFQTLYCWLSCLFLQSSHPLWLPQVFNQALRQQFTCAGYVLSEQWARFIKPTPPHICLIL